MADKESTPKAPKDDLVSVEVKQAKGANQKIRVNEAVAEVYKMKVEAVKGNPKGYREQQCKIVKVG